MDTADANQLPDDPCAFEVAELGRLYRARQLSPVQATRAVLDRIERLNPTLGAYLAVTPASALAAAKVAETQLASGIDLGPLHGIPVSIKDQMAVKGLRTTCASRLLLNAPEDADDATVVRRLRAAGAILVGKTNLHEFALGAPDPDSPFATVQNPRCLGHMPGSSSSGSAVAVAAGLGPLSIGTDTGGSVRHPAGLCGVVGLKPTYGRVSLHGVVPMGHHFDTVGLLGRSVADVAAGLTAIAGYDAADPVSAMQPTHDCLASLGADLHGLRLGLPTNAMFRFGDADARALLDNARTLLGGLGMAHIPVHMPRADELNEVYLRIMGVDMLSFHEHQYSEPAARYGRDMQQRMETARAVSAVQYARALADRDSIRRAWLEALVRVDVLAVPGNVAGAPRHGVQTITIDGTPYPARIVASPFSRIFSVVGFPALSVPIGLMPDGLPIAIQLVAAPFEEPRLLAVGHALEQALGHLVRRWGIEPQQGESKH